MDVVHGPCCKWLLPFIFCDATKTINLGNKITMWYAHIIVWEDPRITTSPSLITKKGLCRDNLLWRNQHFWFNYHSWMCNFNSLVCAIVLTMINMLEVEIISPKGLENSTPIGITSFKFSHAYDFILIAPLINLANTRLWYL